MVAVRQYDMDIQWLRQKQRQEVKKIVGALRISLLTLSQIIVREDVDASALAVLKALSTLVWWKVALPIAGGLELDDL